MSSFKPVNSAATPNGPEDHEQGDDEAEQPHEVALLTRQFHCLAVVDPPHAELGPIECPGVLKAKDGNDVEEKPEAEVKEEKCKINAKCMFHLVHS